MLSPALAIACAIHSLQGKVFRSFQMNIFSEDLVFRLNITCKTIFILSLKSFKNFLSVSIKTFARAKKKILA